MSNPKCTHASSGVWAFQFTFPQEIQENLAFRPGTLNLEMPAVSDNSESTNDSGDILSLSKVDEDSDKKKRTVLDSPEKSSSGSGTSTSLKIEMDYTPQDIAEYIFWTGDEPGVVSALNDFLQDELVDKDDVIKFLEDVKVELKLLKSRYGSVVGNQMAQPENLKFKGPHVLTSPATPTPGQPRREKRIVQPQVDVENEQELVARMNRLNVKLREDSLEEIIYRLAKELFRGGSSGEHSIQKFAHLVEDAGSTGHIPKDLEKNVLDILVSALVDSVSERGYPNRRPSSGVSDHRTPQTNYKI